jgi:hypothetical protein
MQAKKDAIKANKTDDSVEEESEAIPGEAVDAPQDTTKSKAVEAPEMSQAKTATPRKGQAS